MRRKGHARQPHCEQMVGKPEVIARSGLLGLFPNCPLLGKNQSHASQNQTSGVSEISTYPITTIGSLRSSIPTIVSSQFTAQSAKRMPPKK